MRPLQKLAQKVLKTPRYDPGIEWSKESWTHNVFRCWEWLAGRRIGIRAEMTSICWTDEDGNTHVAYACHSWESVFALGEQYVREWFGGFKPIRIHVWVPAMNMGGTIPSFFNAPFMLAIAHDADVTSTSGTTSPKTWTHTVTGSNPLIAIGGAAGVGVSGGSITPGTTSYNSVNATKAVSKQSSGTFGLVDATVWLLGSASTGANTASLGYTFSGSFFDLAGSSTSYSGAQSGSTADATGSASATANGDLTFTVTTIADNCWVYAIGNAVGSPQPTLAADQTSRGTLTFGEANQAGILRSEDTNGVVTPAGNKTMGMTLGASSSFQSFAVSGASFAPAAVADTEEYLNGSSAMPHRPQSHRPPQIQLMNIDMVMTEDTVIEPDTFNHSTQDHSQPWFIRRHREPVKRDYPVTPLDTFADLTEEIFGSTSPRFVFNMRRNVKHDDPVQPFDTFQSTRLFEEVMGTTAPQHVMRARKNVKTDYPDIPEDFFIDRFEELLGGTSTLFTVRARKNVKIDYPVSPLDYFQDFTEATLGSTAPIIRAKPIGKKDTSPAQPLESFQSTRLWEEIMGSAAPRFAFNMRRNVKHDDPVQPLESFQSTRLGEEAMGAGAPQFVLKSIKYPPRNLNQAPPDVAASGTTEPTLGSTSPIMRAIRRILKHEPEPLAVNVVLEDSFSQTNQDDYSYLSSVDSQGAGQCFTAIASNLESCKFYLQKFGAPTGNAVAKIYAITGSFGSGAKPTGAALATSQALDVSTISTAAFMLFDFVFETTSDRIALAAGGQYFLTIEYSGGDGLNRIGVGRKDAGGHAGNGATLSGATWTAQTWDYCFYLFGAPSAGVQLGEEIFGSNAPLFVQRARRWMLKDSPVQPYDTFVDLNESLLGSQAPIIRAKPTPKKDPSPATPLDSFLDRFEELLGSHARPLKARPQPHVDFELNPADTFKDLTEETFGSTAPQHVQRARKNVRTDYPDIPEDFFIDLREELLGSMAPMYTVRPRRNVRADFPLQPLESFPSTRLGEEVMGSMPIPIIRAGKPPRIVPGNPIDQTTPDTTEATLGSTGRHVSGNPRRIPVKTPVVLTVDVVARTFEEAWQPVARPPRRRIHISRPGDLTYFDVPVPAVFGRTVSIQDIIYSAALTLSDRISVTAPSIQDIILETGLSLIDLVSQTAPALSDKIYIGSPTLTNKM